MEIKQTFRIGIRTCKWPKGIHWYGTIWCEPKNEELPTDENVYRVLSAKQAEIMNDYDGPHGKHYGTAWKGGQETIRFDSEEHLIQEGVKALREIFGDDVKIELGSPSTKKPIYYADV